MKRIAYVSQILMAFRGPVRLLVPLIKEAWKDWSGDSDTSDSEGGGRYGKALRRFLKTHGGNEGIEKLCGDDLIKYVYMAVRTYGKKTGQRLIIAEQNRVWRSRNDMRKLKRSWRHSDV